jgi:hypothetical protein
MKTVKILIGFVTVAFAITGISNSQTVSNKVVVDWLKLQQQLIRNTSKVPHVAYSRHFAYTSVALYESIVRSDPGYLSLSGQLNGFTLPAIAVPKDIDWRETANATIATMFRYFYSGNSLNRKLIDSLETINISVTRKSGIGGTALENSRKYGKAIAEAVIAWSENDGSATSYPEYILPAGEGMWVKTPPSFGAAAVPYWCKNRCVVNSDTTLLVTPLEFSEHANSEFYAMAKEVYDVTTHLSDDQKKVAWFWDDSPNGKYLSVFGHWTSILTQVASARRLPLQATCELFVKMSLAQYDASVACWKGKYQYNVQRPITYIHKYIDKNWNPLIETPPHPEYPAAHATLSQAAATALADVLGDNVTFTDMTYNSIGLEPRSFDSFSEAAKEAGNSRLYGGIHYRPSIAAGLTLGEKTARNLLRRLQFRREVAAE